MRAFRVTILLSVIGFTMSCGNPDPVKIGYVAAITGRLSQLGIEGRNGVDLAVQERNETGGVNGRRVEVLVRDDKSTPEVGIAVLNELIRDAAVDAVIGPLTSNMLPAVQSVADAGVLVFSPIMSTAQLSGLDDHFVRANLTLTYQAGILAEKMIQDGIERTTIVFDASNPQYTEELATHFQTVFQERGGVVTGSPPFDSAADPNYPQIADAIIEDNAPAVVFVTTGIDAGVIAQQLWKRNSYATIEYGSGVQLIEEQPFPNVDVILMDIGLPHISGLEVTQKIRSRGIVIPIVALTAYSSQSDVETYRAARMNGFVPKPITEKTLFRVLRDAAAGNEWTV